MRQDRLRVTRGAHGPLGVKHAASLKLVLQRVQQTLVLLPRPMEIVADYKHRHRLFPSGALREPSVLSSLCQSVPNTRKATTIARSIAYLIRGGAEPDRNIPFFQSW